MLINSCSIYFETISKTCKNGRGIEMWGGIGQMVLAYPSCLPSDHWWWLLGLRAWTLEKEFWSSSLKEITPLLCAFSFLSHKMWVRKVSISRDEVSGMCSTFRRAPGLFSELHRCQLFSLFCARPPSSLREPQEASLQFLHLHFSAKCLVQRKGCVTSPWIRERRREKDPFPHHPSTQIAHS